MGWQSYQIDLPEESLLVFQIERPLDGDGEGILQVSAAKPLDEYRASGTSFTPTHPQTEEQLGTRMGDPFN